MNSNMDESVGVVRSSKRGAKGDSLLGGDVSHDVGRSVSKKRKTSNLVAGNGNLSILSDKIGLQETVIYRPRSQLTAGVYKEILSVLQTILESESSEALYEAAHDVISIFKADYLDTKRRELICESLGVSEISDEFFSSMYRYSLLITDFVVSKPEPVSGEGEIAITFDEDEEEEDEEELEEEELVAVKFTDSWLRQELMQLFPDTWVHYEEKITALIDLHIGSSPLVFENELVGLFDYEHLDFLKLIVANRFRIWIMSHDPQGLLDFSDSLALELYREISSNADSNFPQPSTLLDLNNIMFHQGGRLMSNPSFNPTTKTFQVSKKNYDQVNVQAVEKVQITSENLVEIATLPEWAQPAFKGFERLNPVQSKVFPVAFHEYGENMLICAPTGAGKTNIAMLTILNVVGQFESLSQFKVVYIAPMKALVQEVVKSFSLRLNPLGISVGELSGDANISREAMASTQVIVTTPEKWDVITRKASSGFTKLVRLIIIDEVHLLHDTRGPVLEAIVARTVRQIEQTGEHVRLVALSATLPNFRDVAIFLRVNLEIGLFYFGAEYRPVPLEQTYIGIKTKKALKRGQVINEVVFEKVMEEIGNNQILVFVHGRKETAKTAKELIRLGEKDLGKFVSQSSRGVLEHESKKTAKDLDLKSLLSHGIGIHHAGLVSEDRSLVEDLFAARHLSVCVCTLTLAWGVNLPAHTVIIKGTQIYQPEKGEWVELSPMDMMQMMGRAGRPQYDTTGHGIVITNQAELQYYLSLNNMQLPIESQLIAALPDLVNAELALGTITNRDDVVKWLGYTYLHVRMLQNGPLYGVPPEADPKLVQRRVDLAHAALTVLDRDGLVKYERKSGLAQITALGRVASYFYLRHESVAKYASDLKPNLTDIDILRVFAQSAEFKYITVREEEKVELSKLVELVPIPIKGGSEDACSKINVLLQAYVSRLSLEGFALMADMVFVTQNAGRLFRALFEIALKRGWSALAQKLLQWCKIVELRMWPIQTQLRHFRSVADETCRRIERKGFSHDELRALSGDELNDLVRNQGQQLARVLGQIPQIELQAYVQPISRSCLQMKVDIQPLYEFNSSVHSSLEYFWLIVEDVSQQFALYSDQFALTQSQVEGKQIMTLSFTVPVTDPLPPFYFVRVVSDKWIGVSTLRAISFQHLILPAKSAPPTELLDLVPIDLSLYPDLAHLGGTLGPVPTQAFEAMCSSEENVLLAAPINSGKRLCAQIAILKTEKKSVFITSESIYLPDWQKSFPTRRVAELFGSSRDIDVLESSDVIITNELHWDLISRKWKTKRVGSMFDQIGLIVIEGIHYVSESPVFEIVVSRTRFIAIQKSIRLVALSVSAANASDLASWIGAKTILNFPTSARPLEIVIHGFDVFNRAARQAAMSRPLYLAITKSGSSALVFVTDLKQAKMAAADIILQAIAEGKSFAQQFPSFKDSNLQNCIQHGVGYLYEGMAEGDRVQHMFASGQIQILFTTMQTSLRSEFVVILDTCILEKDQWTDYRIVDVLKMVGSSDKKCILFVSNSKREFYKKFIAEPIVVESALDESLRELLNTEIASGAIKSKQDCIDWLTWTFFYRRIVQNPNYYSLVGTGPEEVSDFLSALIEEVVDELTLAGAVVEEEDSLAAADLGLIASYYRISVATVAQFRRLVTQSVRRKGLVEIIAQATEFPTVIIDESTRQRVCHLAKIPPTSSPLVCALWAHFLGIPTTADIAKMISVGTRLVSALVDVVSTCGWLKAALAAMELAPMLKQGLLPNANPLRQIPFFDEARCARALSEFQLEDVFDLLAMPQASRETLLSDLSPEQVSLVAQTCNRYPEVALSAEKSSDGELVVELTRTGEGGWLVLGSNDQLSDIKRLTDQTRVVMRKDIPGECKLYFMSDSFIGCDQEEDVI